MKKLILFINLMLALCLASTNVFAELAIVVNPKNPTAKLSPGKVKKIFLGKKKRFKGGKNIVVIDHNAGSSKDAFLNKVINKNASQFKAYWSRIVFTGKGKAPLILSESDVIGKVASDEKAIGYVDKSKVDGSVKVVATIK